MAFLIGENKCLVEGYGKDQADELRKTLPINGKEAPIENVLTGGTDPYGHYKVHCADSVANAVTTIANITLISRNEVATDGYEYQIVVGSGNLYKNKRYECVAKLSIKYTVDSVQYTKKLYIPFYLNNNDDYVGENISSSTVIDAVCDFLLLYKIDDDMTLRMAYRALERGSAVMKTLDSVVIETLNVYQLA